MTAGKLAGCSQQAVAHGFRRRPGQSGDLSGQRSDRQFAGREEGRRRVSGVLLLHRREQAGAEQGGLPAARRAEHCHKPPRGQQLQQIPGQRLAAEEQAGVFHTIAGQAQVGGRYGGGIWYIVTPLGRGPAPALLPLALITAAGPHITQDHRKRRQGPPARRFRKNGH